MKDEHYTVTKGSVHQVDMTSLNVPTTNKNLRIWEAKLMGSRNEKWKKSTVKAGDFNALLSATDRTSKEKIHKDTVELITTINQQHQIDSYTIFHSNHRNM